MVAPYKAYETLPYPILRYLSSTSARRGTAPAGSGGAGGMPEPWVRRDRRRGMQGRVQLARAQKCVQLPMRSPDPLPGHLYPGGAAP
jgi:hypothetical protein